MKTLLNYLLAVVVGFAFIAIYQFITLVIFEYKNPMLGGIVGAVIMYISYRYFIQRDNFKSKK